MLRLISAAKKSTRLFSYVRPEGHIMTVNYIVPKMCDVNVEVWIRNFSSGLESSYTPHDKISELASEVQRMQDKCKKINEVLNLTRKIRIHLRSIPKGSEQEQAFTYVKQFEDTCENEISSLNSEMLRKDLEFSLLLNESLMRRKIITYIHLIAGIIASLCIGSGIWSLWHMKVFASDASYEGNELKKDC